jgi:hypothetical protein
MKPGDVVEVDIEGNRLVLRNGVEKSGSAGK